MTDEREHAGFSRQDAAEILTKALETKQRTEAFSYQELVAAASEVGVDEATLHSALESFQDQRQDQLLRQKVLSRRKQGWWRRLATYAVTNSFLIPIDWLTGEGWWVQWVLLTWGLVLALTGLRVWSPSEESVERGVARELKRIDRSRRREARQQLQRTVQEKVERFLGASSPPPRMRVEDSGAPPQPCDEPSFRADELEEEVARKGRGRKRQGG